MLLNNKIYISKSDLDRCTSFSNKVISTNSYYARRGQQNTERIRQQIIVGKLGEIATKIFIEQNGLKCSDVDFGAYDKNKSFSSDLLIYPDIKIHVKSQHVASAKMFGLSWTFQYGERLSGSLDKEIFGAYGNKDRIIFCLVDDYKLYVDIMMSIKVKDAHKNNLFRDPIKTSLIGEKKVIYYEDALSLSNI